MVCHLRGPGVQAHWVRPNKPSYGDEWWRPFVPRSYAAQAYMKKIQDYAPSVIVACVAVFFGWHLWNSSRD